MALWKEGFVSSLDGWGGMGTWKAELWAFLEEEVQRPEGK